MLYFLQISFLDIDKFLFFLLTKFVTETLYMSGYKLQLSLAQAVHLVT
jgi:hypothetical protein